MTGGAGVQYFGKDLEAMSFAKNYHGWILDEFRPYLGRAVAEVGAGIGDFSKLILEAGVDSLTAFEPSENMFPRLARALAGDARAKAVQAALAAEGASGRFDAVLYVNVLEHIQDDREEVSAARDALNPGGHLLVFVPALQWLYSDLDRRLGHFRRYVKKDLVALVQNAGLRVVSARYFDFAGILPWYVNFVLLKRSIGGGAVAAYDRLVVPVMRRVERVLPPAVGKNVLLVAQRVA